MAELTFTAREKATELNREVNLRRSVFAKLVANGSLSSKEAARRIALLEDCLRDYRALAEAEEAKERLL